MIILSSMTAPATLISACSLLLLGIYNKYSKIVSSLRALSAEQRRLTGGGSSRPIGEHDLRQQQIIIEWKLLRHRLTCTLLQMRSVAAAASLFLLASLLIAGQMEFHYALIRIATIAVCLGVLCMLFAMGQVTAEASMISKVIEHENPTAWNENTNNLEASTESERMITMIAAK